MIDIVERTDKKNDTFLLPEGHTQSSQWRPRDTGLAQVSLSASILLVETRRITAANREELYLCPVVTSTKIGPPKA